MTATPEFHALIEKIEAFIPGEHSPETILAHIAQTYRMSHAAYLGIDLSFDGRRHSIFYATYPKPWVERYIEKNYVDRDPTVTASLKSNLPVDWAALPSKDNVARSLLNRIYEYDVGKQGITVPIRGWQSEKGLFTLVGDMNEADWDSYKKLFIPDILTIGFYVHCMVVKNFRPRSYVSDIKLSPREILCLEWASNGKTFNDIADIVGISNHTVRIHLDTAREKLKCLNITHAVARAIKLELIQAPR